MTPTNPFPVVIITGLSGSGKSTALKVFEDLGFFCIDGLPSEMSPKIADLILKFDSKYRGLALGMDLRQFEFVDGWEQALHDFANLGIAPQVLFLEAKMGELVRRYATTRRPHPLESRNLGLEQALEQEKELLAPVRSGAALVLDTTDYSIHDLRRVIQTKWSSIEEAGRGMRVHIITFGFKYGVPSEADLVFDLRFLPNPYFVKELRPLSGKDKVIAEYVLRSDVGSEFEKRFLEFMTYLLPLYADEGRYRITIALGCTGGRHRSVSVAESVLATLKKKGYTASIEHRHMELG
ncbi:MULTISPECIES: RNase adapter RapZ [unclassified Pseudodesulfovibrio]|uniref:RNase adapter RapZ n=1 Tax=unclassified Pseudodesulfovibrio TaxID=2661612 RepID=UPI000FEBA76D|nr:MULTISPECIES: RNase adapter RapZ [unclassified Pseudodesulfovibrio]MCJ2163914.1 RNase adapter RapZ [Pseudodesulfovibrio sp. S3-i]RWU05841.1 RNase adapter RapZ [Pseudodesulfovibrio sp. S3]